MKRMSYVIVAFVFAITLILSGCGNGETPKTGGSTTSATTAPESTEASTEEPKEVVKLKFWSGVPEEKGPQAVVDKWNAANPDIQVEYVRYVNDPAGNTKLDTALLSQTDAPDLFVSYGAGDLERRAAAGMIQPLDDLIAASGFDVDGIIGLNNVVKREGSIYYLPGSKGINSILINKAALDEVGEAAPTDWTWDEFLELAKKLNKDDRKGMMFNPTYGPIAQEVLISAQPDNPSFAADGTSNFNHPAFKKGLELQKAFYDANVTVSYAETNANKLDPANELLTGKSAMVYTGLWMLGSVKDEAKYPNRDFSVVFAPMPQMEKGMKVDAAGPGDYMTINSKSAHQEETMKFLAWYLEEGNIEMVPFGRMPSNKQTDIDKVAELLVGDAGKLIDVDSIKNLIKADYTFVSKTTTTALPEIFKMINEEGEKYFMDVQSLDEAVEMTKKRSDEAIKAATK